MNPSQVDAARRRARWPQRIAVGRVVKPHGVRGEVAVECWGEVVASMEAGTSLWIDGSPHRVERVRGAGERLLCQLEGCTDRDAAELFRNAVVTVDADALELPEDGEVYLFELEGCVVFLADGDRPLGHVVAVIEDGGGLLLEVEGEAESDAEGGTHRYLLPYVAAFLRQSDLAAGELHFELPEGLLETCVSTS